MRKMFRYLSLAALIAISGCTRSGMSIREEHGQTYGGLVHAMHELPGPRHEGVQPLLRPSKVGVVQIGEVAPPQAMLDRLRGRADAFERVEPIPGVADGSFYGRDELQVARRQQVERLRRMARGMGMDYLLLYGGTIDHGATHTPWSLVDLTIIGAFVIPSRVTQADARASGALIDVHTGRVMLIASADGRDSTISPSVMRRTSEEQLLSNLRESVSIALADDVIERVRHQ